jgi:hypothetical protein
MRAGPPAGGPEPSSQFDVDSAAPPEQLGVELGPREDDVRWGGGGGAGRRGGGGRGRRVAAAASRSARGFPCQ